MMRFCSILKYLVVLNFTFKFVYPLKQMEWFSIQSSSSPWINSPIEDAQQQQGQNEKWLFHLVIY